MHNEFNTKVIKEEVLNAIKSGVAHMRPRWHFVALGVAGAMSGITLFLVVLYFASFAIFVLQQSGAWFSPTFGTRGWLALVSAVPWGLIACTVFFFVVLEIVIRRYEFAYRRPLFYSVIIIVSLVAVSASFAAPFHKVLLRAANENRLPLGGGWYRRFGAQRFGDVHRGRVSKFKENRFIIEDSNGNTSTIIVTPETRLPFGFELKDGDDAVVVGREERGSIRAYGFRRIKDD